MQLFFLEHDEEYDEYDGLDDHEEFTSSVNIYLTFDVPLTVSHSNLTVFVMIRNNALFFYDQYWDTINVNGIPSNKRLIEMGLGTKFLILVYALNKFGLVSISDDELNRSYSDNQVFIKIVDNIVLSRINNLEFLSDRGVEVEIEEGF